MTTVLLKRAKNLVKMAHPLKKPDGTPLPNLPSGFSRRTYITLDSDRNLYTAYFLEIEKDVVDPATGTLVHLPNSPPDLAQVEPGYVARKRQQPSKLITFSLQK